MTKNKRYSREQIELHLANLDGAGFPVLSTIKMIEQILADNDKLVAALKLYANAIAEKVIKEIGDD